MTPERRYVPSVDESPRTATAFVGWLVERHPPLAAIRDEHLADNDDLLPHVFFGDVTRYASSLARDNADASELARLLTDLDRALSDGEEDDEVENLIWVSFVENAQGVPGDNEEALRHQLRRYPHLASALSHYE